MLAESVEDEIRAVCGATFDYGEGAGRRAEVLDCLDDCGKEAGEDVD